MDCNTHTSILPDPIYRVRGVEWGCVTIRMSDMRVLHREQQAHGEYPGKPRPLLAATTPLGEDYQEWIRPPLHYLADHDGGENYASVDHHAIHAYQGDARQESPPVVAT